MKSLKNLLLSALMICGGLCAAYAQEKLIKKAFRWNAGSRWSKAQNPPQTASPDFTFFAFPGLLYRTSAQMSLQTRTGNMMYN